MATIILSFSFLLPSFLPSMLPLVNARARACVCAERMSLQHSNITYSILIIYMTYSILIMSVLPIANTDPEGNIPRN